eukprot:TRINITY_DN72168_c0_g1_i1.p1 TRINITY_DN72168_c0_g1~~TRINITY_DN72168_c0_g1_i1.p1  ORF type:complete len:309 (+),score=54.35 TRINITY_DN72168_c0_g1_i1:124-927(+)
MASRHRCRQTDILALGLARRGAASPDVAVGVRLFATLPPGVQPPSLEQVRAMPKHICEYSAETLAILAEHGCREACRERLVRNIMVVDGVEWFAASGVVDEIIEKNRRLLWLATAPQQVGIIGGIAAGFGCIPFIFYFPWVNWFNKHYVTADLPPPQDLETMYEIGTWSWGWMEPILGTASFTLLCLQFVRSQMMNIQLSPYTDSLQEGRAARLIATYPQYDAEILADFVRATSLKPLWIRKLQAHSNSISSSIGAMHGAMQKGKSS